MCRLFDFVDAVLELFVEALLVRLEDETLLALDVRFFFEATDSSTEFSKDLRLPLPFSFFFSSRASNDTSTSNYARNNSQNERQ